MIFILSKAESISQAESQEVYSKYCELHILAVRRAYMFVVNGFSHKGDAQDQYQGQGEEDEGEIEIVHTTDDRRTVTGIHAAARAIGKLSYHACQTHNKTNTQPVESTL